MPKDSLFYYYDIDDEYYMTDEETSMILIWTELSG